MKSTQKSFFVLIAFLVVTFSYIFIVKPWYDITQLKGKYLKVEEKSVVIVEKKPPQWARLKTIDKSTVNAIVISEDWAFYQHFGIDLRQIYHSVKDAFFGKGLRGASTISQQLIKNIYFSNKRSFFRKFYELFYTLFLELSFTKNEILEMYLNIIELGENVYGISSGSQHYFKCLPSQLNTRQGAFLAMLLPSPVKYSESFRQKELTDYALTTINKILDKMVMARVLSINDRDYYKSVTFSWEKTAQSPSEFSDTDEEFFDYDEE